jgi:hypothetical protein
VEVRVLSSAWSALTLGWSCRGRGSPGSPPVQVRVELTTRVWLAQKCLRCRSYSLKAMPSSRSCSAPVGLPLSLASSSGSAATTA